MNCVVTVLRPLIRVMQLFVRGILRLCGANVTTDLGADKAEEELRGAIDLHAEASGEIEEAGAMLHSILDLDDVMVGDIMVHRSNLALIDADHPPEKIVEAVLESAYTRLPLWRGDPDNIIGVLHAKALLRAVQANGGKVEGVDIVGSGAAALVRPRHDHAAGPAARLPRPARAFRPGGRRIWGAARRRHPRGHPRGDRRRYRGRA